jgi:hypothetical protein
MGLIVGGRLLLLLFVKMVIAEVGCFGVMGV